MEAAVSCKELVVNRRYVVTKLEKFESKFGGEKLIASLQDGEEKIKVFLPSRISADDFSDEDLEKYNHSPANVVPKPKTTCSCGCKKPIELGDFDENVRLNTFPELWPYPVSREELARYGFKYVGPEDKVECWKCGVKIDNWDMHDLAGVEHYFWSPKCALLNNKAWWGFKILPEGFVSTSIQQPKSFILTEQHNAIEDEIWYRLKMDDMYCCEKKRLESFNNVEWKYPVRKEDLAKYGFYYIGGRDTVKCHFCGLLVNGWQLYDLAFLEHLKYSPNCLLIKRLATNSNITQQESDKKEMETREEYQRLMREMDSLPSVWKNKTLPENQLGFFDLDDDYGQDLCGTSQRTARRFDVRDSGRAKLITDDVMYTPTAKKPKVD
ncbi:UNVERIFIED_CONTAM: hypothetical protein B566_EDAN018584 [Ephemera danica]|nr:hypothetical protein B566_EDAN018584 [Ephemera danica]